MHTAITGFFSVFQGLWAFSTGSPTGPASRLSTGRGKRGWGDQPV
ncbi:hypothetical protein [Kamptonema formosum]|nr:hypothetical protein [Oscillatoria sp. PCC 10802]